MSLEKKTGYIIPIMNCYPKNGELKDPHFTCHNNVAINYSTIIM